MLKYAVMSQPGTVVACPVPRSGVVACRVVRGIRVRQTVRPCTCLLVDERLVEVLL